MKGAAISVLCSLLVTTRAFWLGQTVPQKRVRYQSDQVCATSDSWESLEKALNEPLSSFLPSSIDSVLNPAKPKFSSERPTLYRERHGWCPYSERVFLMLELGNIAYDTIRIDNTGGPRPSYYGGGTTPQMRWEDGRMQGESMDLVEELDARYSCNLHSSEAAQVTAQFRSIFPRARPSSRAAYLFQYSGDPLFKATFEETLQKTDELLAATSGPFMCGSKLSTADVAWAPFLERYRYQLPCLHEGLEPNDPEKYPDLAAWYKAMDAVPAYVSRVKGDASSWRKVLSMAGFGNAGVPTTVQSNMDAQIQAELEEARECVANHAKWTEYAATRPYVAETPHAEAALTIVRNRRALVRDAVKQAALPKWKGALPESETDIEALFLELAGCLLSFQAGASSPSEGVVNMAGFLDSRMCVPRDMGSLPAAFVKLLSASQQ